jgi:multisubunit Na+/H+ antiporter MnhB subunit
MLRVYLDSVKMSPYSATRHLDNEKISVIPSTPDRWFELANLVAMLGWLMLGSSLALPRERPAAARLRTLAGRAVPLVLCAGYAVALATSWGSAPGGGFSSLTGVAALFSSPGVLLAGWVHYLAFDLLVGRAIVDDGLDRGVPRLALLPPLALTFLFGPIGLLVYAALRAITPSRKARA